MLSRAIGIIVSPRATYARVVARPQALSTLSVVVGLLALPASAFSWTAVGRLALTDRLLSTMEAFGRQPTTADVEWLQRHADALPVVIAAAVAVLVPVVSVVLAAGARAWLVTGRGRVRFIQALAVVASSWFLVVLHTAIALPIDYARESLSGIATLSVLAPVVDDTSVLGRLMGAIDLFRLWWLANLSIGLGVLFERPARPVAMTLAGAYCGMALVMAGLMAVLSGA